MKTWFVNGNIITMNKEMPKASAFCVENKKIVFVGSTEEAKDKIKEEDLTNDLKGQTVLPGLNDSHIHLLNYGYTLEKLDLTPFESIEAMVQAGKVQVEEGDYSKENWLLCRGWNQDKVREKRFPTKKDLDKIAVDIPILFTRACGHIVVCNSMAIQLAKEAGKIDDDDNVALETGSFAEDAVFPLQEVIPSPSKTDIKRMIITASRALLAMGITSVQSDDLRAMPDQDIYKVIAAFSELNRVGELAIKVYEQCLFTEQRSFEAFVSNGYHFGKGDDYFRIGPLKLLLDGSLGGRTALLTSPYADDPTTSGIACFDQGALNNIVEAGIRHNFQLAAHGIGDQSMLMFIESLKVNSEAMKRGSDGRHGIVHCQITTPQIIEEMKRHQLLAYIQPIFLDYDLHIVEDRVGDRANSAYVFSTMIKENIRTCLGTDAPVVDINPFENIYTAVTRKDLKGYPEKGYQTDECMTVYEALEGYTINGAYASFEEKNKGQILVNHVADFIVIDQDILSVAHDDIKTIKVVNTYSDGRLLYASL